MFRGTEKVPGSEFNRLMQINGADSNAFTSLDYTAYHQSLDVSRLELAMALEADRMANLDFLIFPTRLLPPNVTSFIRNASRW